MSRWLADWRAICRHPASTGLEFGLSFGEQVALDWDFSRSCTRPDLAPGAPELNYNLVKRSQARSNPTAPRRAQRTTSKIKKRRRRRRRKHNNCKKDASWSLWAVSNSMKRAAESYTRTICSHSRKAYMKYYSMNIIQTDRQAHKHTHTHTFTT